MTVEEMARTYYPKYWNEQRIQALVEAGKLTESQAKAIMEENSNGGGQPDLIIRLPGNLELVIRERGNG